MIALEWKESLTILFEQDQVLEHRKSQVKSLLLARALGGSVISYSEVYQIFNEDKAKCSSELIWHRCVWTTVENVCSELASREKGPLYTAMLANKERIPKEGFWDEYALRRKKVYEQKLSVALPRVERMTMEQKQAAVAYERACVYAHARKYHQASKA